MSTPNAPTPRTAGVLGPPPLIFAVALGAGSIVEALASRPLFAWPAIGYVAGGLLVALGVALSLSVVLQFRRAGTPVSPLRPSRQLVVAGSYRFSRNPDYLGQALAYAGLALALNSLWVLLAAVPALLLVRYGVIAKEERYLEGQFGEDYRRYRGRVRRWL